MIMCPHCSAVHNFLTVPSEFVCNCGKTIKGDTTPAPELSTPEIVAKKVEDAKRQVLEESRETLSFDSETRDRSMEAKPVRKHSE